MACLVLAGCGGVGASGTASAGSYSASVNDTGTSTVIVNLTVFPDGTVTGKCVLLVVGSAAIVGRADLTGSIDTASGTFTATGDYYLTLPPPPNWPSSGPITVTGTAPKMSIPNNPVQVTKNLNTVGGFLNPVI